MIRERLITMIEKSGFKNEELEEKTGIAATKWGNLRTRKQRVNEDHIKAIEKIWPEYKYWIVFGETMPEAGQISPEIEETRKKLSTGT
jgi:hypothetical protein